MTYKNTEFESCEKFGTWIGKSLKWLFSSLWRKVIMLLILSISGIYVIIKSAVKAK